MKSLFTKNAANTNTPAPIVHINSDVHTTEGTINLLEMLGVNDGGEPYAEIFELEFEEPRSISFSADTQRPASGPVDPDKFRIYMNFDTVSCGEQGGRTVLVAHNVPRAQVEAVFDKWNTAGIQAGKSLEQQYDRDSAIDRHCDLAP